MCGFKGWQCILISHSAGSPISFGNRNAKCALSQSRCNRAKRTIARDGFVNALGRTANSGLPSRTLQVCLPYSTSFASAEILPFVGYRPRVPIPRLRDPRIPLEKGRSNQQYAPNVGERSFLHIVDATPDSSDPLAHLCKRAAAVSLLKTLPCQPIRKTRPPSEVAEATDCVVRRLQLKEQRGELRRIESAPSRGSPEVDLLELSAEQELVPTIVSYGNRSMHRFVRKWMSIQPK
jgi:hypothetical protein